MNAKETAKERGEGGKKREENVGEGEEEARYKNAKSIATAQKLS